MTKKKRPVKKFDRKMRAKLMALFSVLVLVLCGLIGRLTYIEYTSGEKYKKKVLSLQSYDSKTIPYQRGDIMDASGTVLATPNLYRALLAYDGVVLVLTYAVITIDGYSTVDPYR